MVELRATADRHRRTVVHDKATAKDFSTRIIKAPRAFRDRTSISGGIDFAMAQLARAPFHANRHTIDVSGDGTHNSGCDVTDARDEALAKGVTINGLVVMSEQRYRRLPHSLSVRLGAAYTYA